MSKETRQAHTAKLRMLDSIRGHESTVAHSFNHTGGICPKCGCKEHLYFFCAPDSRDGLPQFPRCELQGEHLHRMCGACKYPWIERCWDKAMLDEAQGDVPAESEIAAALVALVHRTQGIELNRVLLEGYRGWILHFDRDSEKGTITFTVSPPTAQEGTPAHLRAENFGDDSA